MSLTCPYKQSTESTETVVKGFNMEGVENVLEARETTHGPYSENAAVSQRIKEIIYRAPNYAKLSDEERESMDLIATKFGRILTGNPHEPDHWRDISGYARLVERSFETKKET